jgi:uncharacterized linocin/CFP29 family protein
MDQTATMGLGFKGPSARALIKYRDLGVLRPWEHDDGQCYVTVTDRDSKGNPILVNGKPTRRNMVANADSLFRREDWLLIDRDVRLAERSVLRVWNYFAGRVPFNIPNGFAKIAIQHAIADGRADAILSMSPIRRSERARPFLRTVQIPLPVAHSDFSFDSREIAASRDSGLPLDTVQASQCAREVSELTEKLILGKLPTYDYAGGQIYGLCNFPDRFTATFTHPAASGWNPGVFINEVLAALQTLRSYFFYGPYVVLHGIGWLPYFQGDYTTAYAYAGQTMEKRLLSISKIEEVIDTDFLDPMELLIVQVTPNVIQAMTGMETTTVQWTEAGGFEENGKVMCIKIPRIREDARGVTGYVHVQATGGTTTTTTTTTTSTTTTSTTT